MLKVLKIFWTSVFILFVLPKTIFASQPHYTLIINQVRGTACCDPGNLSFFENQVNALEKAELPGVFAVRFDALTDPSFSVLLDKANERNEMAAFLEITPDLATKSGVAYHATAENWYEASHAYLLGYAQDDRKKLIDTYMKEFKNFFGHYPTTSVAWMIDAYSLQYIYDNYGIRIHEITREQWDTDSTSLIGGPPHYPYFPSKNWALIPSVSNGIPLIIRQTITDPVENYGDFTNSHTSQPNDYMPRDPNFSYFEKLFTQAHNQPQNPYTFALVGLENSMAEIYQNTFIKQLEYISKWQNINNIVITSKDFLTKYKIAQQPIVYAGKNAWWISTVNYRVRIRQINNTVFIDDIRIYNPDFTDPYIDKTASDGAYWAVPFLLDGSKFFKNQTYETILKPVPDSLSSNKITIPNVSNPEPKLNGSQITFGDKMIFDNDWFEIPANSIVDLNSSMLSKIVKYDKNGLVWPNLLRLDFQNDGNFLKLTPSSENNLGDQRETFYQFLLPHLSSRGLDFSKSYLYSNNLYAVFGRNPIRLIFYPKDNDGYPAAFKTPPIVSTDITNVKLGNPDRLSGAVFIDLLTDKPGKYNVDIIIDGKTFTKTVYSTPNCKNNLKICLTHPKYFWWYLKTLWPIT